jgi:hypothetical protein
LQTLEPKLSRCKHCSAYSQNLPSISPTTIEDIAAQSMTS